MSKYNSITIKEAMNSIAQNRYVLPAIQRKFVWRPEQIEMLFDSIMRNYPINSFMMWNITDENIQHNYKFYSFIKDYADKFLEDNPEAPTQALNLPFDAIIDGQQRLTSLYIGLYGSYRYKKPSKWWKLNEETMPTRHLYLDLKNPLNSNIDNEKIYNFKFLTKYELNKCTSNDKYWFKVGDAISNKFKSIDDADKYLEDNHLYDNDFAKRALRTLYRKLNEEEIINYYTEKEQNQDKVLDVFLRTNSGGTALTFSDLLMSIASANWTKINAREEMKKLKDEIYELGNPHFDVSQDVILKHLLVLSDKDVRFKIENFGRENVAIFEKNWENIRKSIISTFELLEKLGFNDSLLRAKNAAIPIAYYVYINNLSDKISKDNYDNKDKLRIYKWLILSLLKGIFGGQSDNVLKNLREVIKSFSKPKYFPLREIIDKFKGEIDKNYSFDDDIIDGFLSEQYKSITGSLVLYLLYPNVVLKNGKNVAQDHLHPKILFTDKEKLNSIGFSNEDTNYYNDKSIWNSVLNLQLLSETDNKAKLKSELAKWAESKSIKKSELFVDDDIDLDIKQFKNFIENRKKNLHKKLKDILNCDNI